LTALIDIVLPIFAIVASGYVCGWKSLLGPERSEALNGFVYWIALPALLFKAMASVELAQVYNEAFLLAFSGVLAATWALTSLAGWLFFRLNAAEAALHGLNGAYPNTGFMSIPLAIAAYGQAAALPAIVATVISVLSVALAIVPIELARQRGTDIVKAVGRAFAALVKNPMILAPMAGLAWAWPGIGLPQIGRDLYRNPWCSSRPMCTVFDWALSRWKALEGGQHRSRFNGACQARCSPAADRLWGSDLISN
jgi:malonate transporter